MTNHSLTKITKDVTGALNVTIPALMPFIQKVIDPFLTAAPYWGMALYAVIGLYGVYLAFRQDELNELLVFFKDHPDEFRQEIVESEEFRKGFIRFFDNYVKERLNSKRTILRNILLGFANSENINAFALEKYAHTLSQLSELDVETLREVKTEETGKNYQVYGGNFNRIDNIYNLISLGLLIDTTDDRVGHNPLNSPFVKPTAFCREFVKYLKV